jgi:hypothetical protein
MKTMKRKVNKKKIRQTVDEVYPDQDYGKGFGSKNEFLTELFALQQKYPECYLEVWTPEDYCAKAPRDLTTREAMIVSNYLYNYVDANQGTTWKKVEHYVKKVLDEHGDI